jgi:Helix-turn-helix domain
MRERVLTLTVTEQRRLEVIQRYREGKISRREAALLLSLSDRQVSRLRAQIETKGVAGIAHGNVGREPANKTPKEITERIVDLAQDKYFDFNFVHMRELFLSDEELTASYATIRRCCIEKGIAKHRKRFRRKRRESRERMPKEGMLVQMDGSHHKWNGKDEWTLIGTIDDANSEVTAAKFFHGETTVGCMSTLATAIERKGLPLSLYTDRAGLFGGSKRQDFSQFERACSELDIVILYAHSPQAKGRIERAWRTFQDRLIPELRLRKKLTLEAANEYLAKVFLPKYWNARNTVPPQQKESHYRKLSARTDLEQVLCIKETRVIANDHTFQYKSKRYAIKSKSMASWAGHEVEIRTYTNGQWSAYYGDRCLHILELSWTRKKRYEVGSAYRKAS